MPTRRKARTGAARTKVKTIAMATGNSTGRACSNSSTSATKSRPRPTHGAATRCGSGGFGGRSKVGGMMAWRRRRDIRHGALLLKRNRASN
jgi:hypothetical protein